MAHKRPLPPYVSIVPTKENDDQPQKNWDEWHIPASDTKGHYTKFQVRMPERLIALLKDIVSSGCYPYRSPGYIIRHALMRHYRWLREHPEYEDGVGSTIHHVNAMVEITREDEYAEDFRMVFEKLDERVRDHRMRGNVERARQIVVKVWGQIMQMDDDFWKGQYEGELKRRFGDLMSGPKTGNGDGTESDQQA